MINTINCSTIIFSCLSLLYIKNDVVLLLKFMYFVGLAAAVLFLLLIPESPRWLFMQDASSQEGIKALNFIAWFNGSKFRVPEDAIMD